MKKLIDPKKDNITLKGWNDLVGSLKDMNYWTVEQFINHGKDQAYIGQRNMIAGLKYLEMTSLFRDNPRFKDSSFEEYLKMHHNIAPTAFYNCVLAYERFEKETNRLGTGTVTVIRQKCGDEKVPVIFKKVISIDKKKTNGGATQQDINNLIETHKKPQSLPVVDELPFYTITEAMKRLGACNDEVRALQKEMKEKDEQILKLKATVQKKY